MAKDRIIEDKVLESLKRMTQDIDCSSIDKIEINFIDGVGFEATIETTEEQEDIKLEEMKSFEKEKVSKETMKVAIMLTSFKDTLKDFLRGVDILVLDDPYWFEALNELFQEIAQHNKKDYTIQVIKS